MQRTAGTFLAAREPEHGLVMRDNVGMLRLLLVGGAALLIALWLALAAVGVLSETMSSIAGLLAFAALATYGGAYWLLRQGRTQLSLRVLCFGMLFCAAYAVFLFAGPIGPLTMLFFIPIVTAGLLGRGWDVVYVGGAAILLFFALFAAERAALYSASPLPPLAALCVFVVTGAYLGGAAWLSGRDLTRVVLQSQERAEELLKKTEQLMEKSFQQVELGSELAGAAQQLQTASRQQASGATEQASAVTEVSTTIEELGSTARQIALSAEHVALAAQQTLENLSSGQDAVDESIQAMERIRGRVADVSTRVLSLGERSQQIGEIIDLIDDISDETHLLALNAAIEAAGAGEHGRRFAVVAAEVKSLANRTLAAAREVKGVIAEIRQATASAVLAAEEGSKEVERGVELAHRAGQTMDNIVMVAERTAQSGAEIGLATAQQQSASEQVVETMREIAEVARQTAQGARQMADSAAILTSIADRLHGIVITE